MSECIECHMQVPDVQVACNQRVHVAMLMAIRHSWVG